MIPKVIHWIWLSDDEYPQKIKDCLATWHILEEQGFEIKKWTRHDFDMEKFPFVKEMYDNKLYAFASDYIRLWILYNYGGIYMDSDMEVIKPIDENVLKHKAFFCGNSLFTMGVIMGCEPKLEVFERILRHYDNGIQKLQIIEQYITPIVKQFRDEHIKDGIWKQDYKMYPFQVFAPVKDCKTEERYITEHTCMIHYGEMMWKEKYIDYKGNKDESYLK